MHIFYRLRIPFDFKNTFNLRVLTRGNLSVSYSTPFSCKTSHANSERFFSHFDDGKIVGRGENGVNEHQNLTDSTCQLVRDYITDSLYNPQYGYFSSHSEAVGVIERPIAFEQLSGKREYQKLMDTVYRNSNKSWLTPVEIFQPWYGYALGEYILRIHDPKHPLKIYEIGGGTGTCAVTIMDYIKSRGPQQVYEKMRYTSVEISEPLAERQLARVRTASMGHMKRFSVQRNSAMDLSAWGEPSEEPCFVIMLEVLDNLTHDRVERESSSEEWKETWVDEEVIPTEILRPLNDETIKRCLTTMGMLSGETNRTSSGETNRGSSHETKSDAWNSPLLWIQRLIKKRQVAWIPTGCMLLLETLHSMRPNMTLIAADFSSLPDIKIHGTGAPLVASKEGGVTTDHSTYLVPKGSADIFFPTDFRVLQQMDASISRRMKERKLGLVDLGLSSGEAMKNEDSKTQRMSAAVSTEEFMKRYAHVKKTQLKNGYSPLLEDFSNTKIYLSVIRGV